MMLTSILSFIICCILVSADLPQGQELRCSACQHVMKKYTLKLKTSLRKAKTNEISSKLGPILKKTCEHFSKATFAVKTNDDGTDYYYDLGTRDVPDYLLKADDFVRKEKKSLMKDTCNQYINKGQNLAVELYKEHGKKLNSKIMIKGVCHEYCYVEEETPEAKMADDDLHVEDEDDEDEDKEEL